MISPRRLSATFLFGLVTLVSIVVLACLLLFAPPDGHERGQLMQFFGRFHPLAVHLPIALVVLVPLLEFAARTQRFSYLSSASSLVLGIATVGSIVAAGLGWSLARGGGYTGSLITQHMWVASIAAALTWGCWALRVHAGASRTLKIYSIVLFASVAAVSLAGYRGGQVSHGENHLTEFMPDPIAELLGVSTGVEAPANSPNGGPGTFYGARIQPIFAQRCAKCHGRSKHKGNLRLDSFEAAMHGGKHGAVIKAGDPKTSELFRRITLSPSDSDFMPSQMGSLSPAEVQLIEQWISAGASGTQPRDAVPGSGTGDVAEVTFPDSDPAVVAKQRADIASAVAQFQQRLPNVLDYQSRGSSELMLNAGWMQSKFGDAEVSALSALADHIISADLSNTSITDKSAAAVAAMKHLRVLRLMHTHITDESLQSLGSLQELETLSLFDTRVTARGLAELARLPKLRHVYVGGTKVSTGDHMPEEVARKLVF
jgi:uncharacterized membrane protein